MTKKVLAQMALTRAWGGLEMMAFQYAQRFSERGYEAYIIALENSPLERHARAHGLTVYTVPGSSYFSPTQTLRLRQYLDAQGIEAVFVHHLRDLWLLRPALIGRPHIEVVGFAHMFLHDINKIDPLHRWLYSRLKTLIALTELQKRELLKCLPIPPANVQVIPNGIDFERFSPSKRNESFRQKLFHVTEGQRVIGVVGRLDPQKGQLEFLRAAKQVLSRFPNVVFALIGCPDSEGPDYFRLVSHFIQKNNLAANVRLINHIEDITETMAALDIFVLPSYREAFGNVLIEAMASGVPVIATNAGGPSETVLPGVTGLLVPPRDDAALAQAMQKFLEDEPFAESCADRAREYGQKKFAVRHVLNQIEKVISDDKHVYREEYEPTMGHQSVSPS